MVARASRLVAAELAAARVEVEAAAAADAARAAAAELKALRDSSTNSSVSAFDNTDDELTREAARERAEQWAAAHAGPALAGGERCRRSGPPDCRGPHPPPPRVPGPQIERMHARKLESEAPRGEKKTETRVIAAAHIPSSTLHAHALSDRRPGDGELAKSQKSKLHRLSPAAGADVIHSMAITSCSAPTQSPWLLLPAAQQRRNLLRRCCSASPKPPSPAFPSARLVISTPIHHLRSPIINLITAV